MMIDIAEKMILSLLLLSFAVFALLVIYTALALWFQREPTKEDNVYKIEIYGYGNAPIVFYPDSEVGYREVRRLFGEAINRHAETGGAPVWVRVNDMDMLIHRDNILIKYTEPTP